MRYTDPSGHRLDVDGPRGPGTTSPGNIRDSYKPAPSRPAPSNPTPSGGGGSTAPSGGGGGDWEEPEPYDPYQFVRLYYKSLAVKAVANRGRYSQTAQQYKTQLQNAAKQSVKQKETAKGNWWDSPKNILSAAGIVTQAAIYTVSQPALNAVSFVGGALSALADDLGFTAGQRSASGSLPEYSAPFGKQNAFASGRILGHGAALVAGAVGVAGGGALAGTGVAATTTGVLAPAGAAAVAGGAVIAAAGAAVVTSATANITAGDPNLQFSTVQGSAGAEEIGNPVKIEGKGSTGRTTPNNLNEQIAMQQVQSNPLENAKELPFNMNDSRWPSSEGWVKMQSVVETSDGTKIVIHFDYNKVLGLFDDFKFVS